MMNSSSSSSSSSSGGGGERFVRMRRRNRHYKLLVVVVVVVVVVSDHLCHGAVPNLGIEVREFSPSLLPKDDVVETLFGTSAEFGPSVDVSSGPMTEPPEDNPLLCDDSSFPTNTTNYYDNSIMVVPRGVCEFERKILTAQKLGARGVVVYNTLASRYSRSVEGSIVWPKEKTDYECGNGHAWISRRNINLTDGIYDAANNDFYLQGTQCASHAELGFQHFQQNCASRKCLLTGVASQNNADFLEACCAWDQPRSMSTGDTPTNRTNSSQITVPSAFISMNYADILLDLSSDAPLYLTLFERPYPYFNLSSLFLVLLGTLLTWYAAYDTAKEYRMAITTITGHYLRQGSSLNLSVASQHNDDFIVDTNLDSPTNSKDNSPSSTTNNTNGFHLRLAPRNTNQPPTKKGNTADYDADSLAACSDASTVVHRNNNACKSSSASTISALDDMSTVASMSQSLAGRSTASAISIANTTGSQSTSPVRNIHYQPRNTNNQPSSPARSQQSQTSQQLQQQRREQVLELRSWHALVLIIFASLGLIMLFYLKFYNVVRVFYGLACAVVLTKVIIYPFLHKTAKTLIPQRVETLLSLPCFTSDNPHSSLAQITILHIIAVFSAYIWAILWLWFGFITVDAETYVFYWLTQDIMGASLCILCLSLVRLNSIKVATILLLAAFIYDVFFVFLSPYFFGGESVMVSVATSGGPPSDPEYCQKYPKDINKCSGGTPLPMLLALPKIHDYRGGMVLLGLGDIVLPGFLLSFAARLDAAKRIWFTHSSGLGRSHQQKSSTNLTTNTRDNEECLHRYVSGYFVALTLAYCIGLLIANLAVYAMGKSQPALLYLVPIVLGTIILIGYKSDELDELWNGHPKLTQADRIVAKLKNNRFFNSSNPPSTASSPGRNNITAPPTPSRSSPPDTDAIYIANPQHHDHHPLHLSGIDEDDEDEDDGRFSTEEELDDDAHIQDLERQAAFLERRSRRNLKLGDDGSIS